MLPRERNMVAHNANNNRLCKGKAEKNVALCCTVSRLVTWRLRSSKLGVVGSNPAGVAKSFQWLSGRSKNGIFRQIGPGVTAGVTSIRNFSAAIGRQNPPCCNHMSTVRFSPMTSITTSLGDPRPVQRAAPPIFDTQTRFEFLRVDSWSADDVDPSPSGRPTKAKRVRG